MFINTIAAMKSDSAYIAIHRTLGVNAARIRTQRGQSQLFVADRSGVDRSALNKFESGKYNPSVEWLCKLADGLEVPVVEFLGLRAPRRVSLPGTIGKTLKTRAFHWA